jgi:hypothetical protein
MMNEVMDICPVGGRVGLVTGADTRAAGDLG